MDTEKYRDIRIILRLSGEDIVSRDVTGVFDDLEAGLFKIDRHLIQTVSETIQLDPLVRDAALERVRKYRGRRIKVKHIREGSFIFDLLVAGVGVWILKQTVGESLKKGWNDSSVHKRLAKAVKISVENLAEHIILILRKLGRKISQAEISLKLPPEVDEPTIFITQYKLSKGEAEKIPSLSKALEQLKKRD